MSGGEQQMLALARAMMSRPKLMLLDEPPSAWRSLVTRQFFDQLKEPNTRWRMTVLRGRAERQPGPRRGALGLRARSRSHRGERLGDELHDDEAVRKAYLGF